MRLPAVPSVICALFAASIGEREEDDSCGTRRAYAKSIEIPLGKKGIALSPVPDAIGTMEWSFPMSLGQSSHMPLHVALSKKDQVQDLRTRPQMG